MPTDWRAAYEAALGERDPAKLADACERARMLINDRGLELVKQGLPLNSPARLALEEALRQLWTLQHKPRDQT
jgi:hypothetical protein